MTYSRGQLAEALDAQLNNPEEAAAYEIVPDPRDITRLDPSRRGTLQIVRERVKPNPPNPQGDFEETVSVFVLTHVTTPGDLEDDLDDLLDEVLAALESTRIATWTAADRVTSPSGLQAYKITCTLVTERE